MLYSPSFLDVLELPRIVARQWWSPARLREWQDRRLRQLVRHAYDTVPFYRQRWDAAGISPTSINGVDDLSRLPVIPGAELKAETLENLVSSGTDLNTCRTTRTSGSTGQPLTVVYERGDHFQVIKAMSVRHYRAYGVGVRDRLALFSPDPAACGMHGWYEKLGFWRRLTLHSLLPAREWVAPLREMRADVITGSPMSLHELVSALQVSRETLPPPRLIITSGARLEPETRLLIERILGAPVYDAYGAHEGGFIAWECPQCEAYHLNVDTVIVEVLKEGAPAPPGEPGSVVITNLFSRAMPFIRYELGDVATLSVKAAKCGRSLPLMERVWGRNDDVVRLPSGKTVGAYPIYMILLHAPFVRQWILVQDAGGACTLRIVPREAVDATTLQETRVSLANALGNEIPVTLELVEQIDRDPKAKWKTIVSHFAGPPLQPGLAADCLNPGYGNDYR